MTSLICKIIDDIVAHNNIICKEEKKVLEHVIFYRPPSIRLSYKGYLVLRKMYDEHKFPLSTLSNQDLVNLYNHSKYPYYIGGSHIIMFDGEEAFAVILSGGIKEWLDNLC